jgi:hypothetical protein
MWSGKVNVTTHPHTVKLNDSLQAWAIDAWTFVEVSGMGVLLDIVATFDEAYTEHIEAMIAQNRQITITGHIIPVTALDEFGDVHQSFIMLETRFE